MLSFLCLPAAAARRAATRQSLNNARIRVCSKVAMAADAATEFPRQPLGQGDVLQLQWQLKHAVDAGMFASAGMLGRLLLGAQRRVDSLPQLGVGSVSETLVLLGDTSYGESEHLSALVRGRGRVWSARR